MYPKCVITVRAQKPIDILNDSIERKLLVKDVW